MAGWSCYALSLVSITRRQFLVGGAAASAAAVGLFAFWRRRANPAKRTMIIGAFQTLDMATQKRVYSLSLVDSDGSLVRSIPLEFHGHGLCLDPKAATRAVVFQKKGPGACELDLATGRAMRTIETVPTRHFYGHGAFSSDGKSLFATETVLDTKVGLIVIRDASTLAIVGELPSFGAAPHDCHLVDDGRILAVTNGGGSIDGEPPNVALIEVSSGKLVEKVVIPGARINAGHLAYTRAHDLVVVSAPRTGLPDRELGGVTVRPHDAAPRTLSEPTATVARLSGETLSVAIHEPSSVVATTTPDANLLNFWSTAGELLESVELVAPRGVIVTRDESAFAVSHGKTGELAYFSTQTRKRLSGLDAPDAHMSGSHLFLWDPPA